jgi:hypothetical protein
MRVKPHNLSYGGFPVRASDLVRWLGGLGAFRCALRRTEVVTPLTNMSRSARVSGFLGTGLPVPV